MSFSTEDKYKIVMALCHVGTVLDENNVNFNSIIRDRLAISNQFVEDRAKQLLSQIEAAREKLNTAADKGNVKRIGDIELDTENHSKTKLLGHELQRLRNELSQLLDIPNCCRGGRGSVRVCH